MQDDFEPQEQDSEEIHLDKERVFSFRALGLKPVVLQGIEEAGFQQCTPIQALVLPNSLKGRDIVGKAQTGTGKTAAFLLTIFQRYLEQPPRDRAPTSPFALILAPTRELALQIEQDGCVLGKYTGLRFCSIVGGMDYERQLKALSQNPDVVVATPGRLIDLYKQHKLSFRQVRIAVIDEADRMFDMGFYPDLKYLMRKLPPYQARQTLLFSATVSYRVTELSYEFMNGPIEVDAAPEKLTAENIVEEVYHVGNDEKLPLILGVLSHETFDRVMIFTNTKSAAQWLGFKLTGNGFPAEVLTGDLTQARRLSIVRKFKDGETKILIATDVASRGLHVDDVTHVINFDVPEDPENYVHRIGRTARAGRSGKAITFGCERYVMNLPSVEAYVGHKIPVAAWDPVLLKQDEAGVYVDPRRQKFSHGRSRQGAPQRSHGGRPGQGRPQGRRRRGRSGGGPGGRGHGPS